MNEALLSLGQVLAVGETTAFVRVWLAGGGVVEVELPAVGATVVGLTGEGLASGRSLAQLSCSVRLRHETVNDG